MPEDTEPATAVPAEVLPAGYEAVASSNIKAFCFRPHEAGLGTLEVLFKNNTRYAYPGVSAVLFREVLTAESIGRAFNTMVKNNDDYRAEKLEDFVPTQEGAPDAQV